MSNARIKGIIYRGWVENFIKPTSRTTTPSIRYRKRKK